MSFSIWLLDKKMHLGMLNHLFIVVNTHTCAHTHSHTRKHCCHVCWMLVHLLSCFRLCFLVFFTICCCSSLHLFFFWPPSSLLISCGHLSIKGVEEGSAISSSSPQIPSSSSNRKVQRLTVGSSLLLCCTLGYAS